MLPAKSRHFTVILQKPVILQEFRGILPYFLHADLIFFLEITVLFNIIFKYGKSVILLKFFTVYVLLFCYGYHISLLSN